MSSATLEPKATPEKFQASPSKYLFDVGEFSAMITAGIFGEDDRLELLDGEIIEMSPINPPHAVCVRKLSRLLGHPKDIFVDVQNPLRLSVESEVYPDLCLLKLTEDFYTGRTPRADDTLTVIEVADSTLQFDRTIKLTRYAEAGILEVWIVDLQNERVLVHKRPLDGVYGDVNEYKRGDTLEVAALEDTSFSVDDILP